MATDWNQKVREIAELEYVRPAQTTHTRVRIQQGELYDRAVKMGLRPGNANQIGTSIESDKFWRHLGLKMITPKGQSRKRTTVYEFEFVERSVASAQQSSWTAIQNIQQDQAVGDALATGN